MTDPLEPVLTLSQSLGALIRAIQPYITMVAAGCAVPAMIAIRRRFDQASVERKETNEKLDENTRATEAATVATIATKDAINTHNAILADKQRIIEMLLRMIGQNDNPEMLEDRRLLAITCRAKAAITLDPQDAIVAEEAEAAYQRHRDATDGATNPT